MQSTGLSGTFMECSSTRLPHRLIHSKGQRPSLRPFLFRRPPRRHSPSFPRTRESTGTVNSPWFPSSSLGTTRGAWLGSQAGAWEPECQLWTLRGAEGDAAIPPLSPFTDSLTRLDSRERGNPGGAWGRNPLASLPLFCLLVNPCGTIWLDASTAPGDNSNARCKQDEDPTHG